MVKVCPSCSNIDIERLESLVPHQEIEETCLGLCGTNFDQSIAFVEDRWIEVEDEEVFFQELLAIRQAKE